MALLLPLETNWKRSPTGVHLRQSRTWSSHLLRPLILSFFMHFEMIHQLLPNTQLVEPASDSEGNSNLLSMLDGVLTFRLQPLANIETGNVT